MRTVSSEKFRELYEQAGSISELLRLLGYSTKGNSSATLRRRIEREGLSYDDLRERGIRTYGSSTKRSFEEIFCENSNVAHPTVRRRVIQDSMIPYVCGECYLTGEWQGKRLVLQLDHIDGNPKNNLVENLRFLCPNCHAQTSTYGAKNPTRRKTVISEFNSP